MYNKFYYIYAYNIQKELIINSFRFGWYPQYIYIRHKIRFDIISFFSSLQINLITFYNFELPVVKTIGLLSFVTQPLNESSYKLALPF